MNKLNVKLNNNGIEIEGDIGILDAFLITNTILTTPIIKNSINNINPEIGIMGQAIKDYLSIVTNITEAIEVISSKNKDNSDYYIEIVKEDVVFKKNGKEEFNDNDLIDMIAILLVGISKGNVEDLNNIINDFVAIGSDVIKISFLGKEANNTGEKNEDKTGDDRSSKSDASRDNK